MPSADSISPQSDPSLSRSSRTDTSHHRPSRRAILSVAGTATASALAGCSVPGDSAGIETFPGGDWHSYGNAPMNANHVTGRAPAPGGNAFVASADWPYAPPVVDDGVVYFARERRVDAITTAEGERWSRDLDREVSGVPAVDPDRGRLYVPTRIVSTTDGPDPVPASVTTLSLPGGEVVRTTRVGDGRTYGVNVVEGDVYARSATACVKLAPDGTERWRRPLDPLVYEAYNLGDDTATQVAPAVAGNAVYVPDRDALVKLDLRTGEERWRVPVDTPYAAPVVDDDGVVQTGWQGTVAVDHAGEVRWRRDLHSRAAVAADDGDVYVVANDLHELDAETGETNWRAHLPSEGTAAPVVTDGSVVVASGDVRAFRRDAGGFLAPDRERWRTESVNATAFSSPVVAAGRVFVVTHIGLAALQSERTAN